jgi:hypothetical protein
MTVCGLVIEVEPWILKMFDDESNGADSRSA